MDDDAELAHLLAEQDTFFRRGEQPSAAVITSAKALRVKKAAQPQPEPAQPASAPPRCGAKDIVTVDRLPLLNPDVAATQSAKPSSVGRAEQPGKSASVIAGISERTLQVGQPRQLPARGFPRAQHRAQMSSDVRSRLRAARQTRDSDGTLERLSTVSTSGSQALMAEIEAENTARLAGMSAEQIRQAQAELRGSLPPSLVEVRGCHLLCGVSPLATRRPSHPLCLRAPEVLRALKPSHPLRPRHSIGPAAVLVPALSLLVLVSVNS